MNCHTKQSYFDKLHNAITYITGVSVAVMLVSVWRLAGAGGLVLRREPLELVALGRVLLAEGVVGVRVQQLRQVARRHLQIYGNSF